MSRLYETDSYIKELRTHVTASGIDDKGRPYIELEDTIFFPEEGGQNADTGRLIYTGPEGDKTVSILDGIISGRNTCSGLSKDNEIRIRYIVSEPVPDGMEVLCKLDGDMRYSRMQNHSGEHVLSGTIHRMYGLDNVGFHLSDTGFVTLDFNGPLSYEQVIKAQDEANLAIYKNYPVLVSFPDKEELQSFDYRSKIEIDGQVRLVTIGDEPGAGKDRNIVDICACCAPHVLHTGEIGIIKVMSVVNWKGGIRVSILCGSRALEYINKEHDILKEVAAGMSTEAVNVPETADKYRKEIAQLRSDLASFKEKALIEETDRLTGPYILFADADLPAVVMKNVYNVLVSKYDGYVGVFAGSDEEGYRYNAGSKDLDSRELAGKLKEAFGAKGGGSAEMIQGKAAADKEALTGFFAGLS